MGQPVLSVVTDDAPTYMRAVVSPTRDEIRERIAKLSALPSGARAILIEMCTLIEFGGKGRCFANNQHFATKACCSVKTVSRMVDLLSKNGLISLALDNNDNAKRELSPTEKLALVLSGEVALSVDRVSRPLGPGVLTPRDRVSRGSGPGVPHNRVNTELLEKNTLLRSRVTELEAQLTEAQSALDAANAAHQEKEQALVLEIGGLNKRIEKSLRVFKDQEDEIAALKAQPKATALAKRPVPAKTAKHLFSESPYATVAATVAALAGTDYEHADIAYYHEVIHNWAESKGERKANWLAAFKGWLLRDSKEGKLKLNPNSQLIPTEHDKQQQSARNTKLGLVDTAALAESLAFCKSLGI